MIAKYLAAIASVALIGAIPVEAQEYPRKPITVVVPFAAGGPTDTVARLLGVPMGRSLKTQILVENVGGAGGTIGAARVAKAPPDGYTLLLHHIGHSTAPSLYRKLPYDVIGDFEPVGLVNEVPMTLVARKDLPPNTLRELITYVKANKDKVTYANAGLGAASHLCGMLFMSAIDTDLTTVPYKGTGPAMNDLLGGQVDFMCDQTTNTTSQIKAGKIKAYGGHDEGPGALAAGAPDPARSRPAELRDLGLARPVRAEGHSQGGCRQAGSGPPGGAPGRHDQAAVRGPGRRGRARESRDARGAAGSPEGARSDRWAPIIKKAGAFAD